MAIIFHGIRRSAEAAVVSIAVEATFSDNQMVEETDVEQFGA